MTNLGLQNNNPGNLKDPTTGKFRVFNTPEEGHQALIQDIKLKQSGASQHIKPGQSIEDFAKVWAPSSDNNNPSNYAQTLSRVLGVPTAYAFDQVPAEKLAEGIKTAEGTSSMGTTQQDNSLPIDIQQKAIALHDQGAPTEVIQAFLRQSQSGSQGSRKTFESELQGLPQTPPPEKGHFTKALDNLQQGNYGTAAYEAAVGLTPGVTFAKGIGQALQNSTGEADKVLEIQKQDQDTQGKLVQMLKDPNTPPQVKEHIKQTLSNMGQSDSKQGDSSQAYIDATTGGLSNKDVALSAAGLAASIALPTLISKGVGMFGVKTAVESPVLGEIIDNNLGKGMAQEFAKSTVGQKINMLAEIEGNANEMPFVHQAINELKPILMQEGGVGSFSQLNPGIAKTLGLTGKALKFLGRAGLDIAGLSYIKHFIP